MKAWDEVAGSGDDGLVATSNNARTPMVPDEYGNATVFGTTDNDVALSASPIDARLIERFEGGFLNGTFARGAPSPDALIEDINALPDYGAPVQESGGAITWQTGADTSSPSQQALVATINAGAAGDICYIPQTILISGDSLGDFPDHIRCHVVGGSGNTGTFTATIRMRYYDVTGVALGSEVEVSQSVAASASVRIEGDAVSSGLMPATARYLTVKLVAKRDAAAATATGTLTFRQIRRSRSVSKQVFTATGANTWYKPAGAQWVKVTIVGAGGGGGSGRRGAAGSARYGGGGGGGGGRSEFTFAATDLTDTVTVTIGAGGPGGALVSADNTNGNNGTAGGNTTFGAYLVATGGTNGSGGTNASGTEGSAGVGLQSGGFGGFGDIAATADFGDAASGGGPGGGGGGGIDAANVTRNGGAGGAQTPLTGLLSAGAGAVVGVSTAVAGSTPTAGDMAGTGGGGGNGSGTPAGGRTAAAGGRGAGGGGSGASVNGSNAPVGAAGGDGYAAIIAW